MLCLTRKQGQSIVIGDSVVRIRKIKGSSVQLVIAAPDDVKIRRGELPPLVSGEDDTVLEHDIPISDDAAAGTRTDGIDAAAAASLI